ncbi:phage holin family protein [Starkeya sp. ORNL1]|uniref:phage holin family protein n=1 Tax=Starkeya sp. ORNL1 TaxID=2709380 RepID=UPI001463B8BB|nr:phage holin family protein [Starkeya sp. ORNL1]QJP15397.1 phage holin family protein [Starkeya sp. ORNL1]
MFHFLLGLAGVELRDTARRAATTAILFALGALLLMIAVVGVLAAIFFALAERYDPIIAALLVAAMAFVVATLFLIVGYLRLKRPTRRRALPLGGLVPPAAPLAAMAPGAVPPPRPRAPVSGKILVGVAAGAALLGLILGRRI